MSNDLDINELKVPATALSRQATETICGALPGKGALLPLTRPFMLRGQRAPSTCTSWTPCGRVSGKACVKGEWMDGWMDGWMGG